MRLHVVVIVALTTATPVLGQVPGRMVVDTSIDRMTGKAAAAVTWTAIDSVHSRYAYLPTLVARCSPHGSIDVYLTGVPAHNSSRHDILGVETGSDLRVDVKLDGWKKPKGSKLGEFTVQNDEAIWYFNGKQAISKLLLPTDTLLLRFTALFGDYVTPEFRLGSDSVRRAVLKHVAEACGWNLPEKEDQ